MTGHELSTSAVDSPAPARRWTFTRCPKCGHAPLPEDQRLPAACPACGVILAKARDEDGVPAAARGKVGRPPPIPQIVFQETAQDGNASWKELLLDSPHEADAGMLWLRSALLVAFAVWGVVLVALDYRTGALGQSFLHGPLLIFHEAGHVVFRLFGEWVMVLGGTLGQLVMPAVMMVALLWKTRDPFGAALAFWLFGVSILDVSPYLYDALDPQLMLLSGRTGEDGGHDWIYLLRSMGMLRRAHGLGAAVHALGTLVVIAAIGWGALVLKKQWSGRAAG